MNNLTLMMLATVAMVACALAAPESKSSDTEQCDRWAAHYGHDYCND